MASAFTYVPKMEAFSNSVCFTYDNAVSPEEPWTQCETVWVLGKKFNLPQQRQKFLKFIKSRFWFTYRKGFNAIGGTKITCDTGWGCMQRCGQMILAQALSVLVLNDEWGWENDSGTQSLPYRRILKQFSDDRSSCYSIHQIAQMGVPEGKAVGQWFGPNTVAQVLKKLSQFDKENVMVLHVAMDNTVCIDEIEKLCFSQSQPSQETQSPLRSPDSIPCSGEENSSLPHNSSTDATSNGEIERFWKPLLLIVPLRLGLSDINPVYFDHLKEIFQWDESVGMVGGKPNHAYYFLGCSNNSLVFLDPHTTQPCVAFPDLESGENFDNKTYHCSCPSKMQMHQLDPSLALGFMCLTKYHFDNLCSKVKSFKRKENSFPLFEVVNSYPTCEMKDSKILTIRSHNRRRKKKLKEEHEVSDENVCLTLDSDENFESDEEFEVLECN